MRPRTDSPVVAAVLLGAALLAAASPARAEDPAGAGAAREEAARKVEEGLMCYCGCTDLTVRACNCGVAAEIKSDIRERLSAGQSSAEVIAAYVGKYGAQIRSAPSKQGFDLLAWWMPFIAVFAAGALVVSLVRRWARHPAQPPVPSSAGGGSAPGAASLDRVDRAMRDIL